MRRNIERILAELVVRGCDMMTTERDVRERV